MKELAPLKSWFETWHPKYTGALFQLFVAALVIGGLVYVENAMLEATIGSMSDEASLRDLGTEIPAGWERRFGSNIGFWPYALPLYFLLWFGVVRLVRTVANYVHTKVAGKLEIKSRNDLEGEVLLHLLRKDDSFFRSHSPGEILNRLAGDVARVVKLRLLWMDQLKSGLLLAGNLVFFIMADWKLALAGSVVCFLGVWATSRMTKPIKEMDGEFLASDDQVKGRFEDLLLAAPEVQVGNLFSKVRRYFDEALDRRLGVYDRFIRLQALLGALHTVAYLLALASLFVIAISFLSGNDPSAAVAMVPVFLKALPELFSSASTLVFLRIEKDRSMTSIDRLLEYDSAGSVGDGSSEVDASAPWDGLHLEDATYQYAAPGGGMQGGIIGVTTSFPADQWTAIAGGAGAGKSTLLQLLVGRTSPQTGSVRARGANIAQLRSGARSDLVSLMPQKVVLIDGTIGDNLLFGLSDRGEIGDSDHPLDSEDLALIESTGVAELCRLRALEMQPGADVDPAIAARVVSLRTEFRTALTELRAEITPYEESVFDPDHWLLEVLLGGKADLTKVTEHLDASDHAWRLSRSSELGGLLMNLGRALVASTQGLLELEDIYAYNRMSPYPLGFKRFELRLEAAGFVADAHPTAEQAATLQRIALTASFGELQQVASFKPERIRQISARGIDGLDDLRQLVADAQAPYDLGSLHPFLTWKQNLVFGAIRTRNRRVAAKVEAAILTLLDEHGLSEHMTRVGLAFPVGRGGERLSGGQRQLVALSRTLLRRTPVVILDEPTSALDPASRDRIVACLRQWRSGRAILTVSHDPDFIREADEVRLIESGRLAASGTFEELTQSSDSFQRIFVGAS